MTHDFNETRRSELHLYDGLEEYPSTGENFLIKGPAGALEARLETSADYQTGAPIAVICHPHPLHGGTMTNKVVHILAATAADLGLPSLRFNFRGVGHSQGRFDHGNGEVEDLVAVVDWFKQRYPNAPLWLAGFSFGAYVAYQAQSRLRAERLILVAPPINMYDFGKHAPVGIPWMVFQGGKDDLVPAQEVSMWVHNQINPPEYEWVGDADHFFHGCLNRIREAIKNAWSETAQSDIS